MHAMQCYHHHFCCCLLFTLVILSSPFLSLCQVSFIFPFMCTDEKEKKKGGKICFIIYGVLFSDITLHDNITQREAHHTGTENGPCQMSACRRTAAEREVSVGPTGCVVGP